jgi:hypothetical protein
MKSRPNLFIVGAPKAGTTSLSEYLKQHSEVFISTPKEPNLFNTDLVRKERITHDDYDKLFIGSQGTKYRGESTPLYLMSKVAANNIKNYTTNARIIIMLRKPIEVLYSAYHQNLYNGIETINNFEKAINEEKRRRNTLDSPIFSEPKERLFYSEYVKYTEQVSRYLDVFGKEKVYIIIYDDFKENTHKSYQELLRFLELDSHQPDYKVFNAHKSNRSNKVLRYIKFPPKFVRKICNILVPSTHYRSKIYKQMVSLNTASKSKTKIDIEFKQALTGQYKEEVHSIGRLLNRDLSHWNNFE